jgi:succinate dehydrogenase / fumarate reductase iron-sulfur subunit
MNLKLKVWRQKTANAKGQFIEYEAKNISPDCSFLEMLDLVNEELEGRGEEPVAFDHDCREGICGMCSLSINGVPHGPSATTTCQLYMRKFSDGDTIYIEPFRARPFPVLRDLCVDRRAFDRIQAAGGFISAHVGSAPDGNALPISKRDADSAMEAAACIGCGACVAACPNASAMLFVGAKVTHFAYLPQGQPERTDRVLRMVRTMDEEGFGNCSNYLECEAVCPAEIPASVINRLNREFVLASAKDAVS